MEVDTWDSAGIKVAGRSYLDLGVIAVGPTLESMCHELIHIMEDKIDNTVDYTHKGWTGAKNSAVATYVLTLREDA
jgi:hypothetical protein